MFDNYYAVLIGINSYADDAFPALRFAEKDCRDLASLLTDPVMGSFPPCNVKTLIGEQATTDNIIVALLEAVEREPEDTVLIFFSGHGFFGGRDDKAYLGSYDVDVEYLKKNPERGVAMEWLHDKIFMARKPGNVIVFLDCCFSGNIILQQDRFYPYQPYVTPAGAGAGGHFAVLSSLTYEVSREDPAYQNGEFTHHLLEGLAKGDEKTGAVSLKRIVAHLEHEMSGQITQTMQGMADSIVLTRPGIPLNIKTIQMTPLESRQKVAPLPHHLEGCIDYVKVLMDHFRRLGKAYNASALEKPLLESVRQALGADLACILEHGHQRNWQQIVSDFDLAGTTFDEYFDAIKEAIFSVITSEDVTHRSGHGYCLDLPRLASKDKTCVVIPLVRSHCDKFMVICGIPKGSPYLQDAYALVTLSFYDYVMHNAWHLLLTQDDVKLEAALIDSLRSTYGYMPSEVYKHRFGLFKKRLAQIEMWFQPIVCLHENPRFVRIDSWEALARDPRTERVPRDLIDAAEVWGPEFQIELDQHCFDAAVHTYARSTLPAKGASAEPSLDGLAINVFPASVMSPPYQDKVREVLGEKILPGRLIVLEISEKREIPNPPDSEAMESKYTVFQKKINEYQREFHVNFAIDDFGVGNSTVSRLASLNLSHIKLDSEISRQDHSLLTIRYVMDLVHERVSAHSKVILEGVDNSFKLKPIYALGLEFVQGYAARKAQPNVLPLDDRVRQDLAACVKG